MAAFEAVNDPEGIIRVFFSQSQCRRCKFLNGIELWQQAEARDRAEWSALAMHCKGRASIQLFDLLSISRERALGIETRT